VRGGLGEGGNWSTINGELAGGLRIGKNRAGAPHAIWEVGFGKKQGHGWGGTARYRSRAGARSAFAGAGGEGRMDGQASGGGIPAHPTGNHGGGVRAGGADTRIGSFRGKEQGTG